MDTDTIQKDFFHPALIDFEDPINCEELNRFYYGEDIDISDESSKSIAAFLPYLLVGEVAEIQTTVIQQYGFREMIVAYLEFSLLKEKVILCRPEQVDAEIILEQEVVSEYAAYKNVTAIYIEKFKSSIIFKIFYNSESYDDELIDKMLESEYLLLEGYPEQKIFFHYFPYSENVRLKGYVSEHAKLIFRE